ncbi:hypothetical protein FACS1894139_19450 [Planctomycetales bacterium]|nr:hypothetical protein FACS1894139_19450 [Planctomycetales bacterium]
MTKLEKRLGAYQPNTTARAAAPVKSNAPSQYHCEREEFHLAKADAKTALDRRQAQAREELFDRQKKQRGEKWNEWQKELPKRGRGKKINALRSVLAHEQAVERATLRDAHRREREQFKHDFPPFPDFKRWLKKSKNPELADEWRYRHGEQPAQIIGDNYEKPRAEKDIRDFSPRVSGDNVFYARRGENSAAFIDKGKLISIHDESRDAVLAALQLAAQKWGVITITGNEKYLATCVQLAAEHGIKIKNPELQTRLAQAREAIKQAAMKHVRSEQTQIPQTPKREPSRGWSR